MSALIIMPCLNCWSYTELAVQDALAQTLEPTVLVVDNGSTDETRTKLDAWRWKEPRLLAWHHTPPLLSLSATWNRALRFAWDAGHTDALVVNNDVRLHAMTYEVLRRRRQCDPVEPWFVTGVGVSEEDFQGDAGTLFDRQAAKHGWCPLDVGGPDFSCFLICEDGHAAYPFDEGYVPAYCEDVDLHRRFMLNGHGSKIFGCAVPFLHWGSRTVNQSEEFMTAFHAKFDQAAAYHARKWGGPTNQETFLTPFGENEPRGDAAHTATPDLQAHGCRGCYPGDDTQSVHGGEDDRHSASSDDA